MEDALVHPKAVKAKDSGCRLNPCCNGRCTRTDITDDEEVYYEVLILVVMEDALVRIKKSSGRRNGNQS